MGPLGIAFTGYQLWRRLSPQQRATIRARSGGLLTRMRRPNIVERPAAARRVIAARVGAATAPQEENPLGDERRSIPASDPSAT
jgi:hypothetical protein